MENKKVKGNYRLPIAAIFMMMILAAMVENVRGVFIPLFKRDFLISDTKIGIMLTISSLGYILFTYIGGILCEKIGQKKVFVSGFICIVISLVGLGVFNNYNLFLLAMFGLNVGLSLISISINTIVPVLFLSFQAVLMNLTHFCYGLGSTVVQRVSGILLFNGVNWRTIYLGEAFILFVFLILFIPLKIPSIHKSSKELAKQSKKADLFKNKVIYFYMFALGFYVFAEMGTGNWFINYMEKVYMFNKEKSSLYLSLFFGLFTIGRLVGGFIVERIGYVRAVLISLVIALVIYFTGINLGPQGMIVISIAGFFFAITFPTLVLTISKVFKDNGTYATGVIVTASSTTSMVLNMLIGFLNDKIGYYNAFYLIPISLVISTIFVFAIYKNVNMATH